MIVFVEAYGTKAYNRYTLCPARHIALLKFLNELTCISGSILCDISLQLTEVFGRTLARPLD